MLLRKGKDAKSFCGESMKNSIAFIGLCRMIGNVKETKLLYVALILSALRDCYLISITAEER